MANSPGAALKEQLVCFTDSPALALSLLVWIDYRLDLF